MALLVSMILTGVAIALLVVYGADIAASSEGGEGFLPFDSMTRGIGLGMPSLILPFVAYFISRKEPSKGLGGMIIATGALILVGGVATIVMNSGPEANASSAVMLLGAGAVQMGLGAFKIIRS